MAIAVSVLFFFFLMRMILIGEMESHCHFDLHFLMAKDVEHFFIHSLVICISSFESGLSVSFAHLLIV
jgi:hypothetical protein